MRKCLLVLLVLAMASSCTVPVDRVCAYEGRLPEIFPDYAGVTIPSNIAPMDFCVIEPGRFVLKISDGTDEITVRGGKDGCFDIPLRKWRRILKGAFGKKIQFTVLRGGKDGWTGYDSFFMTVAPEPADSYIAYRLIPPGYVAWKDMGIYQRCIENFRQREILTNSRTGANCVNCHSFCMQNPDRMLFHSRSVHPGTVVMYDGTVEKLNTKTPQTISPLVYPYWHPSGRYVAFSNNDTHQAFFINHPNRIEVFDNSSDVVVYDTWEHTVFSSPLLKSDSSFETFPTFSPDGRRLYFCTAEAVDSVRNHYSEVRYSLCSIPFNPEDGTFGDSADTLFNARTMGRSVSFPRVSPDGRHLVFTLHTYGNFSIWHHEADLWCIDLSTSEMWPLSAANSDDTESYHAWSRNGRWMVFSSRRMDGLYTRPFFTYIDSSGHSAKPFLLPQKNPRKYYENLEFSYNIPEFISGKVRVSGRRTASALKDEHSIEVSYK